MGELGKTGVLKARPGSVPAARLPLLAARPAEAGRAAPVPFVPPPAARPQEASRLERLVAHRVGEAVRDYAMIADGDLVLVAVSGGKDSYTLLHVLEGMRRRAPVRFELVAVNVDQSYAGYRQDVIAAWLRERGFRHELVQAPTASILERHLEEGATHCSLCARVRRGVLYGVADRLGATKVALGHHADDLIETLLLNQLFAGETRTMPAKYRTDDGRHVVIRPLAYVPEDLVVEFARAAGFPIVCCMCPACGDETMKRKQVKALLRTLEEGHPGVKKSLLRSLQNVNTAHMLDRRWLGEDEGGVRA